MINDNLYNGTIDLFEKGKYYVIRGEMINGARRFCVYLEQRKIFALDSLPELKDVSEGELRAGKVAKLAIRITEDVGLSDEDFKNNVKPTTRNVTYIDLEYFGPRFFKDQFGMLQFLNKFPGLDTIDCHEPHNLWNDNSRYSESALLQFLESHPNVSSIKAPSGFYFYPEFPETYPKITSIEGFSGMHLMRLAKTCPNLTQIVSRVTPSEATILAALCHKIEHISLKWENPTSSPSIVAGLPLVYSNVKSMVVPNSFYSVSEFLKNNKEMRSLRFDPPMTPIQFEGVADNCTKLVNIDLTNVITLTDENFEPIIKANPKLESILLGRNNSNNLFVITDKTIQSIADHCPDLRSFRLYGSSQITDAALGNLIEKSKKPVILDIR